jgi:hypothetical protein
MTEVQYSAVQYGVVQYSAVQYSTVQYRTGVQDKVPPSALASAPRAHARSYRNADHTAKALPTGLRACGRLPDMWKRCRLGVIRPPINVTLQLHISLNGTPLVANVALVTVKMG